MGKPSETAHMVAVARAWEAQKPPETRVCYDPLAEHLLSVEGKYMTTAPMGRSVYEHQVLNDAASAASDYIVLRTRVIDEHVAVCAKDGLAQLVILGAGYDSRAYRLPGLKGKVKVFEVDRPETQALKKTRLSAHLGELPSHVSFVAMDFASDSLASSLNRAGFDRSLKTLVIWEGVTCFLAPEAVDQTLAFVTAKTPEGSSLIFDYILPEAMNKRTRNHLMREFKTLLADLRKPLRFSLEPVEVEQFLTQRGFDEVVNLTAGQCKERYLTPAHGKRIPFQEFGVVHARVAGA